MAYLSRIVYTWRYNKAFEVCFSLLNLSYDTGILSYDQKYINYAL
jgi:hypothetical protein